MLLKFYFRQRIYKNTLANLQIITITSDFGNNSHYLAAVKGKIFQLIPDTQLVDISHEVSNYDVLQASFLLRNSFKNFPVGTIHVLFVDSNIKMHKQFLVVKNDGHYFISADNGIFNLMFDEISDDVWQIKFEEKLSENLFFEKDVFAQAIKNIVSEIPFEKFLIKSKINTILHNSMQAVVNENTIRASIIFIDKYQNAFVNISQKLFEENRKGRKFKLYYFGKNYLTKIAKHYTEIEEGNELALFNENGYLEIAINKGAAAQLLGLRVGQKVIVEFDIA